MDFDQNVVDIIFKEFPQRPNGMKLKFWLEKHQDIKKYLYSLINQYESFTCISNVLFCLFAKIDVDTLKCKNCGKSIKMTANNIIREYCSCKCAANNEEKKLHSKQTIQSDPTYYQRRQQKIIETNLKRYGAKAPAMNQLVVEKMKSTWAENPTMWEDRNQKIKRTVKEKYGVDNCYQIDNVKNKSLRTKWNDTYDRFQKFNDLVIPLFSKEQFVGRNNEYQWECCICHKTFTQKIKQSTVKKGVYNVPVCPYCYPHKHDSSVGEREVCNFCKEVDSNCYIRYTQLVKPYSLDVVSDNSKVAIEFNGLYWHSDKANRMEDYHINKLNRCRDVKYDLYQVFEHNWYNNINVEKNNILKFFNKLVVIKVDKNNFKFDCDQNIVYDFYKLNSNIYHNDLLKFDRNVCVFDKDGNILSAILIKNNILFNKVDRLGVCVENFIENIPNISNYCYIIDNNLLSIRLIKQLDQLFNTVKVISPCLYWTKGLSVIKSDDLYNIKLRLGEKFNSNISDVENMEMNNWNKIYDCGYVCFSN